MYSTYEEYMQNVLGMKMPNTYVPANNYYEMQGEQNANVQEINKLYPDIYKMVYPMVQKITSQRRIGVINEKLINEMTDEIYNAIEPKASEMQANSENANLRNGDVRNPRAKETRRQDSNSYMLRDLIKILIIRELLQKECTNVYPNMPFSPIMNTRCGFPAFG